MQPEMTHDQLIRFLEVLVEIVKATQHGTPENDKAREAIAISLTTNLTVK